MVGKALLDDPVGALATFHGREALLDVLPTGEVKQLLFAPNDPELWKSTVQALVAELEVVVPPSAAKSSDWTVHARDGFGAVEMAYTAVAPAQLERRRVHYTTLRSLREAELARADQALTSSDRVQVGGGHIERLEGDSRLQVKLDGALRVDHQSQLSLVLSGIRLRRHQRRRRRERRHQRRPISQLCE